MAGQRPGSGQSPGFSRLGQFPFHGHHVGHVQGQGAETQQSYQPYCYIDRHGSRFVVEKSFSSPRFISRLWPSLIRYTSQ